MRPCQDANAFSVVCIYLTGGRLSAGMSCINLRLTKYILTQLFTEDALCLRLLLQVSHNF